MIILVIAYLLLMGKTQMKKPNLEWVGAGMSFESGGEEEDRTPDLRIANATLSQLSYPPTFLKY